ncbi:MAG: M6 family metalloprotease domain-containing protein [Muribaculaceae bacterium]|nr:M6 family metalloprotease domain-containing protein [Muribaculaceae bacterium]
MNFKYLIAATALSIPIFMQAVNADPRVRTVVNPDGSTMEVRAHGDEFFNFLTDSERTHIIEKDSRGFYVQAIRDGKPLIFNSANVEMMRQESASLNNTLSNTRGASGPQRMATLDATGRSTYPTIGTGNRSLVVLVEFSDVEFTVENPKEYFTRQLNEPGFSDYGGMGSALDYYKDASNGLYAPQFDVYGPVKISYRASYFKDINSSRMKSLIQESLKALDDEVDFSNYDLDDNGIIDTVFFYYAGYGSADSNTETIWPHQYDYQTYVWQGAPQLILDGKKVGPYACANELKGWNPETGKQPWADGSEPWVEGIGTFVHEYGHVLGLPDLYDVEYSEGTVTPGEWDVMDQGSYNGEGCRPPLFSAYEQWVCGWLEYTEAKDATHYDIAALGTTDTPTAVRIRIPMSADKTKFQSEYFIIESRDKSNWDSCFPESGLMVWRINYNKSIWTSNKVNSKNGSNVEIVYARNEKYPLFTGGGIYPGNDVQLTPSKNYPLWISPTITGIAYDKESKIGRFDYNMVEQSDISTLLHDNPVASADGSRSFTLTWDPAENVDSYNVTVRLAGNGKTIGDFNNKNVGNTTSTTVVVDSKLYWKMEMEAFVTCVVNGISSSKTSNIITFKPSELSTNAVGTLPDSDSAIYGTKGAIIAPEGAKAYNLAGHQVGMEMLPQGIYLVNHNGKTVKVIVR